MDKPQAVDFSLPLLLGGIIGMLLLAAALVVFFLVYQRRLLAQQLALQLEEQQHQRQLLSAALAVQEAERRRIAADLHDEIGSLLSAARLFIHQIDPEANSAAENLDLRQQSLEILGNIIHNARRITHDLMPAELEKFGLFAAVEDLCEQLRNSAKLQVDYISGLERRLEPSTEVALFRVLQELTNNTLKHADARKITIAFSRQSQGLQLHYQDDGQGFDPQTLDKSGLGLRNLESRISLLNGKLNYQTQPGQGLTVVITLPL